jgi:uncharacterized SAM-binding protein YcdF (DUF218 family)
MLPLTARLSPARFLDPMLIVLVVLAVCLFFAFRGARPAGRWGRAARVVAWVTWAVAWAISTPALGGHLYYLTETHGPKLTEALSGRDPEKTALVVLAAGMRTYDRDVPLAERLDAPTTHRVQTAARIWHAHPFAVVVVTGAPVEETACMVEMLRTLGVPREAVVREIRSFNTRENALYTAEILRARGIDTAVVVTSSVHLRRAVGDFERAGIHPIPAAAEVRGTAPIQLDMLLPSSSGMQRTHLALHEVLGRIRG